MGILPLLRNVKVLQEMCIKGNILRMRFRKRIWTLEKSCHFGRSEFFWSDNEVKKFCCLIENSGDTTVNWKCRKCTIRIGRVEKVFESQQRKFLSVIANTLDLIMWQRHLLLFPQYCEWLLHNDRTGDNFVSDFHILTRGSYKKSNFKKFFQWHKVTVCTNFKSDIYIFTTYSYLIEWLDSRSSR